MLAKLTPEQCRVIGVLLEKESTTPDQYPLSLNGLNTGCNQKSNREPVMALSEVDTQNIVDELLEMKLIANEGAFTGRVEKYKHRFCNTQFGSLQLTQQQLAIVTVMLLRGPQTPGELRTRTNRLAEFSNVQEVEQVLNTMMDLNGEQLVLKLEREPGKRESRYAHLFSDQDWQAASAETSAPIASASPDKIAELEAQIQSLQAQVSKLSQRLDDLEG